MKCIHFYNTIYILKNKIKQPGYYKLCNERINIIHPNNISVYSPISWFRNEYKCSANYSIWKLLQSKTILIHILPVFLLLSGQFYNFTVYMVCANSAVNPFVYVIQYHEFQQRMKEIFCPQKQFLEPQFNDSSQITTTQTEAAILPVLEYRRY